MGLLYDINSAIGRKLPSATFDGAVSRFLMHCEAKALSEFTIKTYANELKGFRSSLVDQSAPLDDINAIRIEHFEYYVANMRKNKNANNTINKRLLTVKIFGNYCIRQGLLIFNLASEIPQLKVRKPVGDTFTKTQLKRLLDTPDVSKFEGLRDLAMMLVFADTGIRLSELSAIKIRDIVFADNALNVQRTKNGYARRIPLTKRLSELLRLYLKVRGTEDSDGLLFVKSDDTGITHVTIQFQIREHGRRSGVIKEVQCSPHVFRRTFAKFKIKAGVDVFTLQALMGHSDISELRNYIAIYSTDLDDAIEKGINFD